MPRERTEEESASRSEGGLDGESDVVGNARMVV